MEKERFVEQKSKDSNSKSHKRIPLLLIATILLAVSLLTVVIVLIVVATKKCGCDKKQETNKFISFEQCKNPAVTIEPHFKDENNIFQALSENEIQNVITYLQRHFVLYAADNRTEYEKLQFIQNIDLFLSNKKDTLVYLDNNGPKPVREARATLHLKDRVYFYILSPLPIPTSHRLEIFGDRSNPLLIQPGGPDNINLNSLKTIMDSLLVELWPLYKEIYEVYNQFEAPPSNIKAMFSDNDLVAEDGYYRTTLMWQDTNLTDSYDYRLEMISVNINYTMYQGKTHNVENIVYNLKSYKNVSVLMNEFNAGRLPVVKIKALTKTEKQRRTMKQRIKNNNYITEPIIVSPNGPRFSVKGRQITYFGWEFHYLVFAEQGPALFDVRFEKKRIAYEISLQEASSFYSTGESFVRSGCITDSYWQLGKASPLIKGVDCPKHAIYLDVSLYIGEKVRYVKNAICIFEQHSSVPLRRHYQEANSKSYQYGGMSDASLVARFIIDVDNYDYIIDYVFHQNGAIEVKTVTTGHLLLSLYHSKYENKYGHKVVGNFMGGIHDHMMLYKVDLDIYGTKNSFKTIDLVTENYSDLWDSFPLVKKYLKHSTRKTEKNAALKYNFDQPKYYIVYNENKKNVYGDVRGYQIKVPYKVKQVYPTNHPGTRTSEWSQYQISLSKYKDSERFGSCQFNHNPQNMIPRCSFDKRFEDDENIENEDLVAWIPVGGLHIPCIEDYPSTLTVGNQYSFFIKPFNYFDDDPSFSSSDSVYINKNGDQINVEVSSSGQSKENKCEIPNRLFA